MTENKRFTLSQNGTFHTVHDNVENKPLGVFEFKDDEFPVYACFHKIIDLLNSLNDENEQLRLQLNLCSDQRNEFHRGVRENANRVGKLKKENEQLKQEVIHWKKILDNHQQILAKTLREQYHWLKNEDKIQNNDKTVALLELESISERLGIDLN